MASRKYENNEYEYENNNNRDRGDNMQGLGGVISVTSRAMVFAAVSLKCSNSVFISFV